MVLAMSPARVFVMFGHATRRRALHDDGQPFMITASWCLAASEGKAGVAGAGELWEQQRYLNRNFRSTCDQRELISHFVKVG
jgi:hypothetical protein